MVGLSGSIRKVPWKVQYLADVVAPEIINVGQGSRMEPRCTGARSSNVLSNVHAVVARPFIHSHNDCMITLVT